jgi:hypothetical protein
MPTFLKFVFIFYHLDAIYRSKGMAMFGCEECKQTFSGCEVFALIGYGLFCRIRHYFFTAALTAYGNQVFFLLQCIGMTSMSYGE